MRSMWSRSIVLSSTVLMPPSACSEAEPTNGPDGYEGLSLGEGGSTVQIDASWKPCEDATDCVRVSTSCDACCGEEAIVASREAEYEQAFDDLCNAYQGPMCECVPAETEVMCVVGECTLVPVGG
jgi:hypothetical protein